MALIGAYDHDDQGDYTRSRAYQRYLKWLAEQPPTPEPFVPVGETELVDGPVVAPAPPPKPPRKQRKRRQVTGDDFPRDNRELKALARKLAGRD